MTVCANAASADYNLGNYYGVLTIYPASDGNASGGEAGTYGPYSTSISGVNGNGGGTFPLAQVNLPSNVNPTFAGHEMGHGFGLHHSRLYSTSALAYNDGYDIMSAMATDSFTPPSGDSKNATYGASLLNSVTAAKGPGPRRHHARRRGLDPHAAARGTLTRSLSERHRPAFAQRPECSHRQ